MLLWFYLWEVYKIIRYISEGVFYGKVGFEGVGQAKAVIFFLIVAVIGITQVALSRRKEVES